MLTQCKCSRNCCAVKNLKQRGTFDDTLIVCCGKFGSSIPPSPRNCVTWRSKKQSTFNGLLKVDFQGSHVTSDGGLILVRELDERLGLGELIDEHLSDSRQGTNKQFTLADLLRQSVYSRLAGYEDLNDAERVSIDPTFRLIGSQKIWDRGAALTSTLHDFETEMLASEENLLGLMALNRELVGQAEAFDDAERVVLDLDSTESPVHGQQEGSAYNGHFESVCYHPLLLFNGHGDCLAAKLRPGNVHSAEDWDELLLPEIERQQAAGKQVAFRSDAAFAKPEVYEASEERGVQYAIRIPANKSLELEIEDILFRRREGLPASPWCATRVFAIRRRVGRRRGGSSLRSSITRASCSRASDSS